MTKYLVEILIGVISSLIFMGLTWLFSEKFRNWVKGKTLNIKIIFILFLLSQIPFIIYLALNYDKQKNEVEDTPFMLDSSWDLVIDDDFSNIENTNYMHLGTYSYSMADSHLSVENGKLYFDLFNCEEQEDYVNYIYHSNMYNLNTMHDGYISLEGQSISGSDNQSFGITFRRKDDSYYYFQLRDNLRAYSFLYFNGEEWEYLIPETITEKINPGSPNKIGVSFIRGEVKLFINDLLVGMVTTTHQLSGEVGLAALSACPNTATYEIDNLEIYKP